MPANLNDPKKTPPPEHSQPLPGYLIGDDGEIIRLDETGQPMPLAGVSTVEPPSQPPSNPSAPNQSEFQRARNTVRTALLAVDLLIILFTLVALSLSGRAPSLNTTAPSVVVASPVPRTPAALLPTLPRTRIPVRTPVTRTPTAAPYPECDPELGANAVNGAIVFAVTWQRGVLKEVLRVLPDGSGLCAMPHASVSGEFVALDADGHGGVIAFGTRYQHLDFFTGVMQPAPTSTTLFTPSTSPDGTQRLVVRGGALLIETVSTGAVFQIALPDRVLGVIMAQWVLPTTP
ncbi:MAG: hypothetical protein U0670_07200 [Anaerolineae bacterium]